MLLESGKPLYNIPETILMVLLSTIKAVWFYQFICRPEEIFLSTIRTLLVLLLIYTASNLLFFRRYRVGRIIMHELFAVVILADAMYYSYFNMLPSVSDVGFINILPDIFKSIGYLFRPSYLLLLVDVIFLWYYSRGMELAAFNRKATAAVLAVVAILSVAISVDYLRLSQPESLKYYNKYGLLHYHISQLALPLKASADTDGGGDTEIKLEMKEHFRNEEIQRYEGMAKGRNLIVIQVEALQNFVINRSYNGQELTPNLNRLIKSNSIYYKHYYQQNGKGGTSDCEFSTLNSLMPSGQVVSYVEYLKNDFNGLPEIMRNNGYETLAFHAYKPDFWNRECMYPVEGFDVFISERGFEQNETVGMGLSDRSFFRQTAAILDNSARKPFFAFLVTLSNHHPFTLPEGYGTIKLRQEHKDTLFGRYLNAVNYTDKAIGRFIDELKAKGLYDNTAIAIYGDHHALNCKDPQNEKAMGKFLGSHYDFDQMFNVPLIIHIPGSQLGETNVKAGGQIDFLPTILNIMGIAAEKGCMMGQDLNNAEKGFVPLKFMLSDGSYIDDDTVFILEHGKSFSQAKAWKLDTREKVEVENCRSGYDKALTKIKESEYILKHNLLKSDKEVFDTKTESHGINDFRLTKLLKNLLLSISR